MGKVHKGLMSDDVPDDVDIVEPVEWVCKECGNEVWSATKPELEWKDGHKCNYVRKEDAEQ